MECDVTQESEWEYAPHRSVLPTSTPEFITLISCGCMDSNLTREPTAQLEVFSISLFIRCSLSQ